ncbi:18914_t:CDS:1, partial [Gigaspora rosea]
MLDMEVIEEDLVVNTLFTMIYAENSKKDIRSDNFTYDQIDELRSENST